MSSQCNAIIWKVHPGGHKLYCGQKTLLVSKKVKDLNSKGLSQSSNKGNLSLVKANTTTSSETKEPCGLLSLSKFDSKAPTDNIETTDS